MNGPARNQSTLDIIQRLRDEGHEPNSIVEIGLQLQFVWVVALLDQHKGDYTVMTQALDSLRTGLSGIVEQVLAYRNETWPPNQGEEPTSKTA